MKQADVVVSSPPASVADSVAACGFVTGASVVVVVVELTEEFWLSDEP